MTEPNDPNKIYKEHDCEDRDEYLANLADDYGVSPSVVGMLADVLGPNEDFDGLVTELEDYMEMFGDEEDWDDN
jgi:hypothetical protein